MAAIQLDTTHTGDSVHVGLKRAAGGSASCSAPPTAAAARPLPKKRARLLELSDDESDDDDSASDGDDCDGKDAKHHCSSLQKAAQPGSNAAGSSRDASLAAAGRDTIVA